MSPFLASCCIALLLGICTYVAVVRPRFREYARSIDEIRMLDTWWQLESSEVVLTGREDPSGTEERYSPNST